MHEQVPRISTAMLATSPGHRSGFMEEATWRNDDGDLRWSFTLDRFRRLKAYSPRVKLFVFGIGANANAESVRTLREDSPRRHQESIVSLGWFFLDLRTPDLPERWFKLQNSPFGGELLVSSTFLPTDFGREQSRPAVAPSVEVHAQARPVDAPVRTHGHTSSGTGDADCLQFGKRQGTDVFLISVLVRGATNLMSVVKQAVADREAERAALISGFWLSYSLFDVVVQTDVFFSLQKSEFPAIRDSFRIKSCVDDLRELLQDQRVLSIYLCTQDRVLASADLPFTSLLESERLSASTLTQAPGVKAQVDGSYRFGSKTEGAVSACFSIEFVGKAAPVGTNRLDISDVEAHSIADETSAVAPLPSPGVTTVSVAYVRLSATVLQLYAEKESIELEVVAGEQAVRCPVRFNAFTAEYALGDCPDLELQMDEPSLSTLSAACFSSTTDYSIAGSSVSSERRVDERTLKLDLMRDGRLIGECVLNTMVTNSAEESTVAPDQVRSIPGVSHTYRVMLRVNALKDFESSRPIVISYTNPFTGKERVESSILSVVKKAEVEPTNVYCLFVLHRDEASLKEVMDVPIVLDVALAQPDGSRDTIGSAVFSLNFLYHSEQLFCCPDPTCSATFRTRDEGIEHCRIDHDSAFSEPHTIKSCSLYIPVMSVVSSVGSRHVGAMQIEAYLEDEGPMTEEQVRRAEEMRLSRVVLTNQKRIRVESHEAGSQSRSQRRFSAIEDSSHNRRSLLLEGVVLEDGDDDPIAASDTTPPAPHAELTVSSKELERLKAQLLRERTEWLNDEKKQQQHWKKRVADAEKARMDELEDEWARREEERSGVLKAAQAEYQKLEHQLRVTLAEVETRERKLAVAEAALERDQRMLREDNELLRKRLQAEQSHSVSLAQKQVEALEKRVAELQNHLQGAEKRALQLEEDFAEYRRQQRKVPEAKLREEISSLRGQVAELERVKQAETHTRQQVEANVEKMKAQLEKMAKLVQVEKKKNETRVVEELEQLRLKYIAREERYVLDGDREELKAIKKQLEDLRCVHVTADRQPELDDAVFEAPPRRAIYPKASSPSRHRERQHLVSQSSPVSSSPRHRSQPVNRHGRLLEKDRELQRLEREREALLASGAYDRDSFLVRELERRIVLRQDHLAVQ